MNVSSLTCEYITDPLGIDAPRPRLSWMLNSTERGQKQTAYHVLAARSEKLLRRDQGDLWDSGKVELAQSVHVRYAGEPLRSRERCFWKVMVWGKDGKPTEWSPTAWWEMGLLEQSDWNPATWIRLKKDTRNSPLSKRPVKIGPWKEPQDWEAFPSPLFRREFDVRAKMLRARAYICGLGYYELYINGKRIGDQALDPGQTTYDARALYVIHDITTHMRLGRNAVGIWLGNGFYGQNLAFAAAWLAWGPPTLIAKVVIDYADGASQIIGTDTTWRAETSPILFDNVYAGETYDARREHNGWAVTGFDDSRWQSAQPADAPTQHLQIQTIPPIKRIRVIKPARAFRGADGHWIFDLGQNIAGWVRLRVNEPAGTPITLRHTEILTPDGRRLEPSTLGVIHTGIEQRCIYICKGGGAETWEPRFTYHGFRYVEVAGACCMPEMEGVHVRSAVEPRGSFQCSDELLNRIYQTSLWTIEDNLHSTAEDCPHREKCAWLGDAHCVAETAIFNFDMAQFWSKFMADIETTLGRGGQTFEGIKATPGIPCNIAVGRRLCGEARPDWGAAIVLLPWYLYLYYADTEVFTRHYDSMKRFVNYVGAMAKDHIVYQGYGDWCPPNGVDKMECPVPLTSTAYHYAALGIMNRFAGLLNKPEDAACFSAEMEHTRAAFVKKFFDPHTQSFGCQTANAVALRFGLAPNGAAWALARDVLETHRGLPWVGIHGGRPLYTALCEHGFDAVAFEALTKPEYPSYSFLLSRDCTVWPEEATNFQDDKPVPEYSLNHLMQAGFAAWFHESVAGIRPTEPGFKRMELKPHNFAQLTAAKAEHQCLYGLIQSSWKCFDKKFEWEISIPPNTTATVYVPARDAGQATSNGGRFVREENRRSVYEIESGSCSFKSWL